MVTFLDGCFRLRFHNVNIRTRIFLIFIVLGLLPALLFGAGLYLFGRHSITQSLQDKAQEKVTSIDNKIQTSLQKQQNDILALASSEDLRRFIGQHQKRVKTNRDDNGSANFGVAPKDDHAAAKAELDRVVKNKNSHFIFVWIVANNNSEILFSTKTTDTNINYKNFLDVNVWNLKENRPLPSNLKREGFNTFLYYTVPVFINETDSNAPQGALVAVLKLDELVGDIGLSEKSKSGALNFSVILDNQKNILYHTNQSLRYQTANTGLSESFAKISEAMQRGESGLQFCKVNGDNWLVSYQGVEKTGLSVAVGENYSAAVQGWNQVAVFGFSLIFLSGTIAAFLLWRVVGRYIRNLDRVAKETAAIAERRNLDTSVTAFSSEDLQSLGVSISIIKEQVREQMRQQAEAEQFQAFMRVTAVLTHDLKNSIFALSMLVNSMEKHFDDEEFREDAMKSLHGITTKLQGLLERLNQPVQTLSGEYKPPKPHDIVSIIKRMTSVTVQNSIHELELNLPERLIVKIDPEKIEKVIENIIINSLEAMNSNKGKVTIIAGNLDEKESFFSISDTGIGMSEKFRKEKLFHPFNTTKKKGLGLGLYSCYEIVIAHGGRIEVESKQNFGTTFKVVLPSV